MILLPGPDCCTLYASWEVFVFSVHTVHACTHANITVRVSAGYQAPEQTCSCVLRARLKMVFYCGVGTVQWEPTVTACLSAFKTERSFSGITMYLHAPTCLKAWDVRQSTDPKILLTSLILSTVIILVAEPPLWSLMAHLVMANGTEWRLSGQTLPLNVFLHQNDT